MSTPQDPGRPEDRPAEQSGYPDAPPPSDYPRHPQGEGQGYPPAPDYDQGSPGQYGRDGAGQEYGQGAPGQYGQGASGQDYGQGGQGQYGQGAPGQDYGQGQYGQGGAGQYGEGAPGQYGQGAPGQYGQGGAGQEYGQGQYGQGGAGQYGEGGSGQYGQGGPGQYGQGGPGQQYGQGAPGQQPYSGDGPWQQQYGQGQPGQQPYGQGGPGQQPYPGGAPGQPYAGGPGGSASYGNAPAYNPYSSPGYGTPPDARRNLPAPTEVIRASQLMIASVVIGVLGAIITFASSNAIKDSIRQGDPTLTPSQVDSAYGLIVGTAVVFGLIFAVLYLLLAWQVRKGKNWARIVTWVLAGLGVLGGLLGLFGNGTGLEKVLNVIQLLIAIGIIVLLTRKPANEYFAAMRAPRY